ncbi:LpqB family beta-propeller domain-containing protein [Propionicicella superfundia]|uniref:LpqB family beta-propeller domain-containing protein n=1 Tax=Propionicicella superfundia TaxID=348582 RepID=UPI00040700AD|nr:LpqB family beta-propeller domain-containing protein [Propionicicella superfundia]
MKRTLWVILMALVLTGCATLPTSGPVVHHDQQHEQQEGGVEIAPEPPSPGASPLLIVEGFLHATATYQQGYTAARQYLTSAAAAQWEPESGIQVYEEGSPSLTTGDEVVLRSRLVGEVDTRGTFTQVTTTLVQDFGLVKEGGEWRIGRPPRGILVSDYLFRNAYRTADLYFLSAQDDVLVPDPIVVPRGTRDLTAVVAGVLDGPSAWLAPAVTSALPDDAGITVDSAEADSGGVVDIRLSAGAASLEATARSRLAAQLAWTLAGLDQTEGIRLYAGETRLDIAETDADGVLRTTSLTRFSPVSDVVSRQLFGLHDASLVRVSEESGELTTTAVQWQPSGATSLSVDAQAATVAVVVNGKDLWVGSTGGESAQRVRTGADMIRPQYARDGALWSYAGGFSVWQDGRAVAVAAPDLAGSTVRAFRISPDGVRVAVVLGSGSGSRLALLRVERADGTIRLSGLTSIGLGPSRHARDVAWVGASSLAVSYDSGDAAGVVTTDVAGTMVTDQNLPSSRTGTVVAASSRIDSSDLIACDGEGRCSRFVADQRWTALSGTLQQPTYPS